MALSVQNIKSSTRAGKIPGGLQLRQGQITLSVGSNDLTDYGGGFGVPLGTLKTNLGIRSIFAVLSATAENGAGTQLSDKVWWTYDHIADKLRFFKGSTGPSNMAEENTGVILGAGTKIRVVLLGV